MTKPTSWEKRFNKKFGYFFSSSGFASTSYYILNKDIIAFFRSELQKVIDNNTDQTLGTVDYDGIAEEIIKMTKGK